MKRITFFLFILFILSNYFGQSNRSVIVWTCLDNDVNKLESYYLVNPSGEKKLLNRMRPVSADPFFNNGLKFMIDENSGKMGCIDETGRWVIEPKFDYSNGDFYEGLAPVSIDYKYGYIDMKGNWVIKPRYSQAFSFSNGIALVNKSEESFDSNFEKNGYFINTKGEEIAKWSEYEFEYRYQGKIALATDKKGDKTKYGLYSFEKKKYITKQEFEVNSYFFGQIDQSVPLFPVSKNGKWGFIDDKGKLKIPHKYDDALPFSDGMAAVKLNEKWGFIDAKGKLIIACQYNSILPFHDGKSIADFSFINKKGTTLDFTLKEEYKTFIYEGITNWNDEFIGLTNEIGSWDILNWKGEVIWKGNCEGELTCFPEGSLVKLKDGSSKCIEDIKIGDELISENQGKVHYTKVNNVEIHEKKSNDIFEISYEIPSPAYASAKNLFSMQSNTLRLTGNHPVLTKNGIKKAENLIKTDIIYFFDSSKNEFLEANIASIKKNTYTGKVYNLKTNMPNYLVQDIVVMMK